MTWRTNDALTCFALATRILGIDDQFPELRGKRARPGALRELSPVRVQVADPDGYRVEIYAHY
jgi:hypothetical protein